MNEIESQNKNDGLPFFRLINNHIKFRLFLLLKLPAAFFAGLRIKYASEDACAVSIHFSRFTQNPFDSTYFACLAMAAELSTGALAMSNIYKRKPSVSMLIVSMESKFYKKATGYTIFTCEEGMAIKNIVQKAKATGESQSITVKSTGRNIESETVAEFWFTWSFKQSIKMMRDHAY